MLINAQYMTGCFLLADQSWLRSAKGNISSRPLCCAGDPRFRLSVYAKWFVLAQTLKSSLAGLQMFNFGPCRLYYRS